MSDDCISRHKAIVVITACDGKSAQIEAIEKLPSVTPKPKTGHWIRITNGAMKEKYICSECGRQIEDDGIEVLLPVKYPYCHCGAKMVEPQERSEKE